LSNAAGVGSVAVGDEVGYGFHAPIGLRAEVRCGGEVARIGGDASEGVEGEDFDVGFVVAPRIVEYRGEPCVGTGNPISGVHRGQKALAERSLFSATGGAMPRACCFERHPRSCRLFERAQDAAQMYACERG
jgi:hypothetical protein